jgi:4-methylaminobutanoate oxidase (formaldehyde-forming)
VAELPDRARIVVVGGGVGGASVAYHLARRGETDVLLVERAELTSGSTFHSAGLVGQLRSDPALTRMNVHSVALYRELAAGEHDPGWTESGSLRLASSPERLVEIRGRYGPDHEVTRFVARAASEILATCARVEQMLPAQPR